MVVVWSKPRPQAESWRCKMSHCSMKTASTVYAGEVRHTVKTLLRKKKPRESIVWETRNRTAQIGSAAVGSTGSAARARKHAHADSSEVPPAQWNSQPSRRRAQSAQRNRWAAGRWMWARAALGSSPRSSPRCCRVVLRCAPHGKQLRALTQELQRNTAHTPALHWGNAVSNTQHRKHLNCAEMQCSFQYTAHTPALHRGNAVSNTQHCKYWGHCAPYHSSTRRIGALQSQEHNGIKGPVWVGQTIRGGTPTLGFWGRRATLSLPHTSSP